MLKIIAKSTLKPGCWEKAAPLYKELIEETHKEKGCIEYNLFLDTQDEHNCYIIETWENAESHEAHTKSEHMMRILPLLSNYRTGPAEVVFLKGFSPAAT